MILVESYNLIEFNNLVKYCNLIESYDIIGSCGLLVFPTFVDIQFYDQIYDLWTAT